MTQNHQGSKGSKMPMGEVARLLLASVGPAFRLLVEPTTLPQWRRLLREGIDPITHLLLQANNTAVINRLLNGGTKVVFISSYPRSGNTWMRFLLSDILLQMHNVETATQLPVHPDDLIPEFRYNSLARRLLRYPHWAQGSPMVFVKTHALPSRVDQIVSGFGRPSAAAQDYRALYLYRSPEDALVSFYHYCLHRAGWQDSSNARCDVTLPSYCQHQAGWNGRALDGIDAFCLKEVSGWIEMMSSYLRAADDGFPVFFVSYEWLYKQPATVLGDLLRWLGMEHDGQMVDRAIANMRFRNLQAMEIQENKAKEAANDGKLFFRRGQPGSGPVELKESTLREIHERTAALMSAANQRRIQQASENPAPGASVSNTTQTPLKTEVATPQAVTAKSNLSPRLQQT